LPVSAQGYWLVMLLAFFLSNTNPTLLPSRHLFLEQEGCQKRDVCDFFFA